MLTSSLLTLCLLWLLRALVFRVLPSPVPRLITGVSYDKAALANLAFAGTKAEGALVTGVSYKKADIDTATFTGEIVDIAASFAGNEGDIEVAGLCHDYEVKTAEFVPAAIELAVGDITVAAKEVTVQ